MQWHNGIHKFLCLAYIGNKTHYGRHCIVILLSLKSYSMCNINSYINLKVWYQFIAFHKKSNKIHFGFFYFMEMGLNPSPFLTLLSKIYVAYPVRDWICIHNLTYKNLFTFKSSWFKIHIKTPLPSNTSPTLKPN